MSKVNEGVNAVINTAEGANVAVPVVPVAAPLEALATNNGPHTRPDLRPLPGRRGDGADMADWSDKPTHARIDEGGVGAPGRLSGK